MSRFNTTIDINCDLCGVEWESTGEHTMKAARRALKLKGWLHISGEDICPQCAIPWQSKKANTEDDKP